MLAVAVHTRGLLRVGRRGLAIGCHAALLACTMAMRRCKAIVRWLGGRDCVAVTIRTRAIEVVMAAEGGCHGRLDMEQALATFRITSAAGLRRCCAACPSSAHVVNFLEI